MNLFFFPKLLIHEQIRKLSMMPGLAPISLHTTPLFRNHIDNELVMMIYL